MGRRPLIIRRWLKLVLSSPHFRLITSYRPQKICSLLRYIGLIGNLELTKKVWSEINEISVYHRDVSFSKYLIRGALEGRQYRLLDWITGQMNALTSLIKVLANNVKGYKRDLFEYIYSKKAWNEIELYYLANSRIHPDRTHLLQESIYAYTAREGFVDLLAVCPVVKCVQLALLWAASKGHTDTVVYLLQNNAKPTLKSILNALRYNHHDCVGILLEAGAPRPASMRLQKLL